MKTQPIETQTVKRLITDQWAFCFNTQCPLASQCFRQISMQYKEADLHQGLAIYPDAINNGACQYFVRLKMMQTAWGMNHMLKQVEYGKIGNVRQQLINYLGSISTFYRYNRGEKHLSSEQQQVIVGILKDNGCSYVTFDHYEHEYILTDQPIEEVATM